MASRRRDLPDHTREIRLALNDPHRVAELLELERSREEKGKWRCPRHGGTSLSLRRGSDGTLQVRCFGCDLAGDVFVLVAEVRGLDVKADFRRVLAAGAEVAGLWAIVEELEGRDRAAALRAKPRPAPAPRVAPPKAAAEERTYPLAAELEAVWSAAGLPSDDTEAAAMLAARGLDANRVDALARVVAKDANLPRWARYQGQPWTVTGHRLILPAFDALGVMRSVRAWRVVDGDTPKRLPPTGHKAAGLVLADDVALGMLRGTYAPKRVLIVEGEPDFLTWATRPIEEVTAILGVVSGAWSGELAARVPSIARVIVRTHHDASGDKYAEAINVTLRDRCTVLRSRGDDADG